MLGAGVANIASAAMINAQSDRATILFLQPKDRVNNA
jgi:hypothetical protein